MILIVAKNHKDAAAFADMFYFMGILSYPATPANALSESQKGFRSVLFIDGNDEYEELVSSIRAYSIDLPIFSISKGDPSRLSSFFDREFIYNGYISSLICDIADYQKAHSLPLIGTYRLSGIDASVNLGDLLFFDKTVHLTKTELMIFRYLISSYPIPAKAANILKYAFRSGRMPEITNIRTHISVINSKFSGIAPYQIITSEPRIGYTVMTPEKILH